jgi:hypothetical protein
MKARLENIHRHFLGPVTDRSLASSFFLCADSFEEIYRDYGFLFRDLSDLCKLINYGCDYPKSDDVFAARWNTTRQTLKPLISSSLYNLHSRLDEIHFDNWMGFDELLPPLDGKFHPKFQSSTSFKLPQVSTLNHLKIGIVHNFFTGFGRLRIKAYFFTVYFRVSSRLTRVGVIGSIDMVHGPIQSFPRHTAGYSDYWSEAYNVHCQKWSGVMNTTGSEFIYFDRWGVAGKSHDLSSMYEVDLDSHLAQIDKFLLADRIYDGGSQLLTSFRGNPLNFTPIQKKWNSLIHSNRCIVENGFSRVKNFSLLRHPFRGTLNDHRMWGYVVASLVNVDLRNRPLRN